jgi:hypothetical protein
LFVFGRLAFAAMQITYFSPKDQPGQATVFAIAATTGCRP